MRKRKFLYFLLALLLSFTLTLNGCGNGNDNKNDGKCGDFTLISPSNGAQDVETVPQFEWSTSKNALKYTFTIATDSNFTENVYIKQNIASPYFTIPVELEYETTYYWKAEAIGKGEDNKKTASNAPFSFTTQINDEIAMSINHLSYLSGDQVEITYTAPESAQNVTLYVSKDMVFADESQLVLSEQISGGSHSFGKSSLSGRYYARISADINDMTVYTEGIEFYIGTVYKLHDFSEASGGGSGENKGIRLFNTNPQMKYEIVNETLKIEYNIGSYLNYTIIDFSDDLKEVISNAAYFHIRYRCEEYLGYFLCKMRGDDSTTSNWMDYYINNIHSSEEWKQALIAIKIDTVAGLNRLSMGVSTNLKGAIYVDDIYFILPPV